MSTDPAPILALVGPTGSGKSALALEVAEQLGAEIVAVDAFTVYRGMDIGTAKPTLADRERVAHHVIDVLDPEQDCTVRWFQQQARAAVADIQARGRLPLLVGGSGLYFRAVVDDLRFPPTDPQVRAAVADEYADAATAFARLQAIDPAAAAAMDPGNHRRAVRALEVIELTGRPFSEFATEWETFASIYDDFHVIGITVPRESLVAAIEERTRKMMAAGWVDEARALSQRNLSGTARKALGYAEVFSHLAGEMTLAEATEAIAIRTRQYAAAQSRWFRKDPRVRWRAPSEVVQELAQCIS